MSKTHQRLALGALVAAGVGAALWVRAARDDAAATASAAAPVTVPSLAAGAEPQLAGASVGGDPALCSAGADCGPHGAQGAARAEAPAPPSPPPRLVDLGTETCKPCKAMLKVLDQLHARFPPTELRADFINVRTQEAQARRFKVRIIPTQVFLSPEGKELFRHVGFLSADAIVEKWAELGYLLKAGGAGARPASGRAAQPGAEG